MLGVSIIDQPSQRTWVVNVPEGPPEPILIQEREAYPKDLRTKPPFLDIAPCFCGELKGHNPLKHVNPSLGMRTNVLDILVERARKALANGLSSNEVQERLEREDVKPFWAKHAVLTALG